MTRARGPSLATLLLAGATLASSGCGSLFAFAHDKTVGPVSPAGRMHSVTAGANFRVTETGVTADDSGSLWRPYPRDLFQRLTRPQSFWYLIKGGQAFASALSPVVWREAVSGQRFDPEVMAATPSGLTASEVFERLGPPKLWIRRKEGSLMAYRYDVRQSLTFYLGVPPGVADSIPGLNNLNFRYTTSKHLPYKSLLFFDGDDRLLSVSVNGRELVEEVQE